VATVAGGGRIDVPSDAIVFAVHLSWTVFVARNTCKSRVRGGAVVTLVAQGPLPPVFPRVDLEV
jgi:hypothetical protein